MPVIEGRRATWIAAGAALALAIAIRVNNAFQYTLLWGFDAKFNWRYIERLTGSWELPAPDADWSTAHPPLFYYTSAAVCRLLGDSSMEFKIVTLRLLVSAGGLVIAALAVVLVRRVDPGNLRRAVLAGALVLFLPVHIYMSSMLTEEVVVAALMSIALVSAGLCLASDAYRPTLHHAAFLGVVSGLALLTKLTGVLVVVAVAGALLIDARRRGDSRSAVGPVLVMLLLTAVVGGWYYARNLIEYGYLYPHGLEAHKIMFTMPPGKREILDYLRIPVSLWTDPQVLDPGLLRSVWGSTYLTMWFDGHRVFLPRNTQVVSHVGTLILALAVLPTAAYAVGLLRGARRAVAIASALDSLLVSMVGITLAGYVVFTWKNPWFVTSKGSFLLCLSVPYAYYTSEVLDAWLRRKGWSGMAVAMALASLLVIIVATFTYSELFWNTRHMWKPGVLW